MKGSIELIEIWIVNPNGKMRMVTFLRDLMMKVVKVKVKSDVIFYIGK